LKTTGDRPPHADDVTPAGFVAADAGVADRSAESAANVKPQSNGGRNKGRKRRRKRRRPVYAPGSGPGKGAEAAAATVVAPAKSTENVRSVRRFSRENDVAPLYAALDLGTNNCRLLVATPRDYGFRIVDAFSRIVRLGEAIGSR